MKRLLKKYWLLFILLIVSITFFYFHLYRYLTIDALIDYRLLIKNWAYTHYLISIGLYILTFTVLIACGIPCATFLTLLGGFLFGTIAVLYAIFSTTTGGLILYFTVRTAFGEHLASTSMRWVKKIEQGFKENAFNYLLTLRLVPIFPCWLSNISAGILNIPITTFLAATIIGIFPSTLIYTLVGRSFDKILAEQNLDLLNFMLTPSILLPLLGLAILSLVPVVYKNIKKRNKNG